MLCKKALEEANGDEEKAIEILRKKGEAKAAKKADRETTEGVIVTKIDGNKAAIVRLSCETDFVAKNEEFVAIANQAAEIAVREGAEAAQSQMEQPIKDLFTKLGENMTLEVKTMEGEGIADYIHSNAKIGALVNVSPANEEKAKDVAMQIAAMNPAVISPEEVAEDLVVKEKEIWAEQLKNEGKPEDIIEKIMMGKEKKFREESALIKQSFVKNGEQTVEQYLGESKVTAFIRLAI